MVVRLVKVPKLPGYPEPVLLPDLQYRFIILHVDKAVDDFLLPLSGILKGEPDKLVRYPAPPVLGVYDNEIDDSCVRAIVQSHTGDDLPAQFGDVAVETLKNTYIAWQPAFSPRVYYQVPYCFLIAFSILSDKNVCH